METWFSPWLGSRQWLLSLSAGCLGVFFFSFSSMCLASTENSPWCSSVELGRVTWNLEERGREEMEVDCMGIRKG